MLIDSIKATTPVGLRHRVPIGLMVYSFPCIGDAFGMRVEGVHPQHRLWVRLREKGGKPHAMPCHYNPERCLPAYMEGADLAADPKVPLCFAPSAAATVC